jgi:predicted DNA binding protein
MPFGRAGGRGLVEINALDDELSEIVEEIRMLPTICKIDIASSEKGKIIGAVATNKCVACKALTGSDCFLTSASSKMDGKIEWTLITGGKASLQHLFKKLEEFHCQAEIVRVSNINDKNILTARQKEIVRIALEKGYFDYPKKTNIRELANDFDISISTLSEILRKGQRKIILKYFREYTH